MENKSIEVVSLCQISEPDMNGKTWLNRLADLSDGRFQIFEPNNDLPRTWGNRSKLFLNTMNDRPDNKEDIGVWEWSAIPNENTPEKDYIRTKYLPNIQPIQICVLQSVSDEKELIAILNKGIVFVPASNKILFAYHPISGGKTYKSVLCSSYQLEKKGDAYLIKSEILSLPGYDLLPDDFFKIAELSFLSKLELGEPKYVIMLRTPEDVIKDVFVQRTSWASLKLTGIKRDDYKKFKSFLDELQQDSLYDEIADLCHCTVLEAKTYVTFFVHNIDNYLDGTDLETEVLLSAIDHSEKLKGECERIVEKKWYSEHSEQIEKANADLENINRNIQNAQNEYSKQITSAKEAYERQATVYQLSLQDLSEQEAKLKEKVAALEKLGEDVKAKVQETIDNARKDASDFIKNMTFQYGYVVNENSPNAKVEERMQYVEGKALGDTVICESPSWKEELETVTEELLTIGVDSKYAFDLTYVLYAAFCIKAPLLLAGPAGISIANALSAAVCGKEAGRLRCSGQYNKEAVDSMKKSDDEIIIISTPFHSEWIDNIDDIIEDQDKYYIFVCPFVEDLAIEPKGIFNYMLPIETEMFISKPREKFDVVGKRSGSFIGYSKVAKRTKYNKQMQMLKMSNFHKNTLQTVLTNAGNMGLNKPDIEYLVSFYAYVVATGKHETFLEILKQDNKISKEVRDYLEELLGEE